MKKNISYTVFFKLYGLLIIYLTIILGILIYFSKISKTFWNNNLKLTTQIVLDENNTDEWSLGKAIPINNPLSQSAACFEARNKKNGEMYKAVIIRIQTLYGPIPATFVVDSKNTVKFIGFSSVHGKIQKQLMNNNRNKRIDYWQKKSLK